MPLPPRPTRRTGVACAPTASGWTHSDLACASGLCARNDAVFSSGPRKKGARRRPVSSNARPLYLILDSRNSTCFLATGSYFFITSLAIWGSLSLHFHVLTLHVGINQLPS